MCVCVCVLTLLSLLGRLGLLYLGWSKIIGVGDRVFYETLYRQRPDSIMAQEWYATTQSSPYLQFPSFGTHPLFTVYVLFASICLPSFSSLPGGYFHERCISYGILPNDEAEHIWQKLQERKRRLKMGGGDLTPPPAAKKKSKGVKSSKAIKEEGYDPELQISAGDAIGRASL